MRTWLRRWLGIPCHIHDVEVLTDRIHKVHLRVEALEETNVSRYMANQRELLNRVIRLEKGEDTDGDDLSHQLEELEAQIWKIQLDVKQQKNTRIEEFVTAIAMATDRYLEVGGRAMPRKYERDGDERLTN